MRAFQRLCIGRCTLEQGKVILITDSSSFPRRTPENVAVEFLALLIFESLTSEGVDNVPRSGEIPRLEFLDIDALPQQDAIYLRVVGRFPREETERRPVGRVG